MENACHQYLLQIQKAKDMLVVLEAEMHNVKTHLKSKPDDAYHMRELKQITLDMTITLNELEHCQSMFDDCMVTYSKAGEKYND
ncbi:MAG TPA: hypothetical protein VK528_00975 [Flavobacterium sp.]|nr:hypothetical protein [Flavobacterium sp.]